MGQAQPKHKGKISRVLAAKCALSIRVDALGETSEPTVGYEGRTKVEERLRQLEGHSRPIMTSGCRTHAPASAHVLQSLWLSYMRVRLYSLSLKVRT